MAQHQAAPRDNVHALRAARADMPAEALPAGTRLDEFEIVGVLGTGGFGIVYLATDLSLDRRVAIKEYLPVQLALRGRDGRVRVRAPRFAAAFDKGREAFTNEARLLAGLDHPAMVKVHRHWDAHGTAYMAMHYVQGETLRQARRRGRLPAGEAALRGLLAPLLDALALLHACGVTHRDIAPDNILLRPDGSPVLLDFGSARRIVVGASEPLTAVLKPCFAPIEQYGENAQVRQGPWTDVYALGGVIAYLLEGRPPPTATARAVHDDRLPLAERGVEGISRGFLAAVDWALAVRPQDRPQSIAELRAALEGRLRPPRGDQPAAPRRRLPLHAGAGAAALLLVAGTWFATPHVPRAAEPLAPSSAVAGGAAIGGSGSMVRAREAVALGGAGLDGRRDTLLPNLAHERVAVDATRGTVALERAGSSAQPDATREQLALARNRDAAALALTPAERLPASAALPLPAAASPAAIATRAALAAAPGSGKAAAAAPLRARAAATAPLLPPPTPRRVARDDPLHGCMSGQPLMRALCLNQRCSLPRFQAHARCAYMHREEQVLVGREQIAGR